MDLAELTGALLGILVVAAIAVGVMYALLYELRRNNRSCGLFLVLYSWLAPLGLLMWTFFLARDLRRRVRQRQR